MKMSDLIFENPTLLLLLEHLDIDFSVGEKTVFQICQENNISESVFLLISNIYNGFYPNKSEINKIDDAKAILRLLKNSHHFYKEEKYPELRDFIKKLQNNQKTEDIILIEKFFNEYVNEVIEHLDYEELIAFPYFFHVLENKGIPQPSNFSAKEYKEHHTDIETKLADLKNLILKHISLKNELPLRRKFLYSLFELEADLKIHSIIEEMVLIPFIEKQEK